MGGALFTDLIKPEEWQKVQNAFSDISSVDMRTVDPDGRLLVPRASKSRFCDEFLKGSAYGMDAWGSCWPTFMGGKAIVDKNQSFICPSGFHNFIAPLSVGNGRVIAYIMLGPVILVMRKPKEDYRKLAEELSVDLDRMYEAIKEVRVISFHRALSLVELIRQTGSYIVNLSYDKSVSGDEVLKDIPARFKAVLDTLLEVAVQASGADMGSIMLKDKNCDCLTIRAAKNLPADIVSGSRVAIGEGLSGSVARDGVPLIIDAEKPDSRIAPYLKRPYLGSAMVVPIIADDKAYGVMNLSALEVSSVRFNAANLNRMVNLVNLATDAFYTPVKQYIPSKSSYFDLL